MNGRRSEADVRALLEEEASARNREGEFSAERPDPLWIARERGDEWGALVCALFGYGNARAIVGFLRSLDFSVLEEEEQTIRAYAASKVYRFQNGRDIGEFFVALSRMKREGTLRERFVAAYRPGQSVLSALGEVISRLRAVNRYSSRGYDFLIGQSPAGERGSPLKRWQMYLRWMVRHDCLDMGLWPEIDRADLIMPLDTHTFAVSRALGLLHRKSCDMRAARELTDALRRFDPADPVKYDFALYRIGQERTLLTKKG